MTNMVYDCDIENSAYYVISMGKTVEEAYKVMQGLVSKELLEQMHCDYHSTKGEEVKAEPPAVRENDAEGKSLDEIKEMAKAHTYLLHNNGVRHAKKLIGAMESWMDVGVKIHRSCRYGCIIRWDDGTETEVNSYESAMKLISSTADKIITSDNVSAKMMNGIIPISITTNIPARRGNWLKKGIETILVKIGGAVNTVEVVH